MTALGQLHRLEDRLDGAGPVLDRLVVDDLEPVLLGSAPVHRQQRRLPDAANPHQDRKDRSAIRRWAERNGYHLTGVRTIPPTVRRAYEDS